MKYVSIDIETTGLRPSIDQILEVAMVLDDLENQKPLVELPFFHAFVKHPRYFGDPFALAMNAKILKILGDGQHQDIVPIDELVDKMRAWLDVLGRVTLAGKNVGAFDLQFLKQIPLFDLKLRHRILDVGNLLWRKGDTELPNLDTCLIRAGIKNKPVTHCATEDALAVIECIRYHWRAI